MKFARRTLIATGAGLLGLAGLRRSRLFAQTGQAPLSVPVNPTAPVLPVGMNLAGIADWDPGFPFRNLMWGARPWQTCALDGSGGFNSGKVDDFSFDENGYPLEVPLTTDSHAQPQIIYTILPNHRARGTYVLLHDGEGEFAGFGGSSVKSASPGRVLLSMKHDGQLIEQLCITRSKRGNHIRNIRILSLQDEHHDLIRDPFLPEILEFCRPFHCLRFMDWGSVNNNIEENWSDRKNASFYTMVAVSGDPEGLWGKPPTPFQRRFAGGVAFELMIQLANMTGIDPWICIPHRATDGYIGELAKLVHTTLDPKLTVYVEYSNELWNWGFKQAGWMIQSQLAGTLVEAKGGTAWKDASKTQGVGHPERIGALFRRAFGIWEKVWQGADRKRLVRVCTVQAAWFDASRRTLQWCLDNGGADAISPSAYIGPDDKVYEKWALAGAALTPHEVIDDLRGLLANQRAKSGTNDIVAYANRAGVPYVAYEAGQHIQPKGQAELPYNAALAGAQSDPAMYDLYIDLLRYHRDLGCRMFGHFSSIGQQGTRYGSWGAKGSYTEPDAASPKMRALIASNTPRS
ncbi:hypothetical protein [Novosphingobium sp.]|uniref:hypothetical protein n=1 Tax=Novosphingobium sp. TaxID=1874826 RepID=UPI003B51ED72